MSYGRNVERYKNMNRHGRNMPKITLSKAKNRKRIGFGKANSCFP